MSWQLLVRIEGGGEHGVMEEAWSSLGVDSWLRVSGLAPCWR